MKVGPDVKIIRLLASVYNSSSILIYLCIGWALVKGMDGKSDFVALEIFWGILCKKSPLSVFFIWF